MRRASPCSQTRLTDSLISLSCRCFFFSSRRRHTRWPRDWSSDVCSSDLIEARADGLLSESAGARRVVLDLGRVARLDTAGAWLIDRARQTLDAKGVDAKIE